MREKSHFAEGSGQSKQLSEASLQRVCLATVITGPKSGATWHWGSNSGKKIHKLCFLSWKSCSMAEMFHKSWKWQVCCPPCSMPLSSRVARLWCQFMWQSRDSACLRVSGYAQSLPTSWSGPCRSPNMGMDRDHPKPRGQTGR